jgi:hypothetical protein
VLEIGFGPGLAIADIARRLTTGTAVGAGFRDCRFDVRNMKPVAVACALGRA